MFHREIFAPGESVKFDTYPASVTRPGLSRMLLRGAVRRCPWCGFSGAFFDGWFEKSDACHGCHLRWRRGDSGFELGAAAVSAIIVMGPLLLALGVVVAFTWPEMPVVPLLIMLGMGAVILPMLSYPTSYTLWQALDIVMRPVTVGDFEAAAGSGEPSRHVRSPDA